MSTQYDYQQIPPPVAAQTTSTLAIISLVAGVLGWIGVLGIGPLVAIITGHMAKNEIRESGGTIGGSGLATAGLVLGYLNLVLILIGLCLVLFTVFGLGSFAVCLPFANGIQ